MRNISAAGIVLLGVWTLAWGGGSTSVKKEDVPKYLGMLKNSTNAKDRALAAERLGRRGAIKASDVKDAIEPLQKALQKDSDMEVKKAAATALGNIASEPASTVALLISALKEKNNGLKTAAIAALGQYGGEAKEAIPALREIVKEKTDKALSQMAGAALKSITGARKK